MPETGSSLSPPASLASSCPVLQLAARGEWIALEQTLKGMDKGDLAASQADPVSGP